MTHEHDGEVTLPLVVAAKKQRREGRHLRDRAKEAFAAGDYKMARDLNRQVVDMMPDTDIGQEASRDLANSGVDPYAIKVGLASALVYLLAWGYALSGLY